MNTNIEIIFERLCNNSERRNGKAETENRTTRKCRIIFQAYCAINLKGKLKDPPKAD